MQIRDFMAERAAEDRLIEARLSRVIDHIVAGGKHFGMVSACTFSLLPDKEQADMLMSIGKTTNANMKAIAYVGNNKDKFDDNTVLSRHNIQRHENLKMRVAKMGYLYIEMAGIYQGVREKCLLIPNITREDVINLGIMFEQDTIIHKNAQDISMIRCRNYSTAMQFVNVGDVKRDVELCKNMMNEYWSKLLKESHQHQKLLLVDKKDEATSYDERLIVEMQKENNFNNAAYLHEPLKWYTVMQYEGGKEI